MKKRLLSMALLMIVSFMVFNLNAYADATMVADCNIEKPNTKDEEAFKELYGGIADFFYMREYTGNKKFYRLTDNKGTVFMAPNDKYYMDKVILDTIPSYHWSDQKNILSAFDNKICPRTAKRYDDLLASELFLALYFLGNKEPDNIVYISEPRFVIYEFVSEARDKVCEIIKKNNHEKKIAKLGYTYDDLCGRKIIGEVYSDKGAYGFVGADLEAYITDEVTLHQLTLINNAKIGDNYFKIDETDTYGTEILIGGHHSVSKLYSSWYQSYLKVHDFLSPLDDKISHYDEVIEKLDSTYEIKILYSSAEAGRNNLKSKISEWYKVNSSALDGYNDFIKILEEKEFINECDEMNEAIIEGNKPNIKLENILDIIEKLDKAQVALETAYNVEFTDCGTGYKTSTTSHITSCAIYSETLGINEIVDLAYRKNDEHIQNEGFLVDALYNETNRILEEIVSEESNQFNTADAFTDLNKYTEKFYTVIAYLRSEANKPDSELKEYKEQIDSIYKNYREMVERHKLNIYPVIDCETLLGEKLINKINSYLNIFKIAVPIIVIGFGIVDFTKAVFAGEEEMKKAKESFIKRLFIALLIFLIPTVVNLILYLANKVWPIISTDSCGLY